MKLIFFKKYNKVLTFIFGILIIYLIILILKPDKEISYSAEVKPILNNKCISCHGGVKKNAGLSFLFRELREVKTDQLYL